MRLVLVPVCLCINRDGLVGYPLRAFTSSPARRYLSYRPAPVLKHLLSECCLYAGAGVARGRGGYEGIAELEGRGCFSV